MVLYDRQLGLFDPNKQENQPPIVIIGAGTLGSWTTLALAKMGLRHITVIDFDKVEEQNIPNQFFMPLQVGAPKIEALHNLIKVIVGIEINRESGTVSADSMKILEPMEEFPGILICAVDNMATRNLLYGWLKANPLAYSLYIDARSGGNTAKVYSVVPSTLNFSKYESTLHSDDLSAIQNAEVRALSDVPCTARSVVDVSLLVAGVVCNAVRRHIISGSVTYEQLIDTVNGFSLLRKDAD